MGIHKEKSKGFDRSVLPWQAMVLILILRGSFCPALDHSGVYPIGPATTVPPSSYSNDLVPRSNPIDSSGNLVMTGNVAAGMQFRGRVPYGAATDLRASLGSTYLDAFLRNSQGALDTGFRFGDRVPFYSPTATVSRMVPGSTDLFTPSTSWGWIQPNGAIQTDLEDTTRPAWPFMVKTEEAQKTVQRYSSQGPWTDLQTAQSQVYVRSATPEQGPMGMPALPEGLDTNEPLDRFRTGLTRGGMDRGLEGRDSEETPPDPSGSTVRFQDMGSPSSKRDRTVPPVGSLDAFWQIRYEQCMEMARTRLKEGHPQQSVDAYTLAILYKPADTLALAGKSHALFVCGEFVSSALFLERALEICPDYVRIPIDLAQWVGGVEVLRSRVEEASHYLRQNDSPELRLILAYTYYRMGDMRTAQETVEKATEGARPRPALQVLKQAVSDALRGVSR